MLSIAQKKKFLNLAVALEPENLTCDGELSPSQVQRRYAQLHAEWRALENQLGLKVSEGEPFAWSSEINEHEQRRLQDKLEKSQIDGLDHPNVGVWTRQGGNGFTAYYIHGTREKDAELAEVLGVDPLQDTPSEYVLYSRFARILFRNEEIARFDSLEAARDAGNDFLKTVTADLFREHTGYTEENIQRELEAKPAEYQ